MSALLKQLMRFGVVGLVGTACQYVVLIVLVSVLGANAVLASTLGACVGALINYALNRAVQTFDSDRPHGEALPRFMLVAAVGFVLNGAIMAMLIHMGIHYLVAQVVATAVVFIFNFVANRSWTFHKLKH